MNKPKYKLGNMIRDAFGTVEIIISIEPRGDSYKYKTQYDDPRPKCFTTARFECWWEETIGKYYTVIGNLFDKETKHA